MWLKCRTRNFSLQQRWTMSSPPSIEWVPTDGETKIFSEISSISSTTISNGSSIGYDYGRLGNVISASIRSDSVSQDLTKPMLWEQDWFSILDVNHGNTSQQTPLSHFAKPVSRAPVHHQKEKWKDPLIAEWLSTLDVLTEVKVQQRQIH